MVVYQDIVKLYALTLESLEDKVMNRPEGVFWERLCAESILIAYHNKFEIEVLAYEGKVSEHPFYEFQFLEAVYLLVSWFFYQSTISVYE
jgi:hypothetical protein